MYMYSRNYQTVMYPYFTAPVAPLSPSPYSSYYYPSFPSVYSPQVAYPFVPNPLENKGRVSVLRMI